MPDADGVEYGSDEVRAEGDGVMKSSSCVSIVPEALGLYVVTDLEHIKRLMHVNKQF